MAHLSKPNADLIARIRRIAGQVNAVERALEQEAECSDVLHRVAAVRGAVNGLLDEIIAEHLKAHVSAPGLADAERAAGTEELLAVIRRYSK
ncbi:MAG: transcriptional regulator [Sphingomonas sp.]|uniref:metal/formaldehyde-sensitive transcriptional repressor n=1 Tax=Sphingomonas sp. TaxID=28214 RepID=UPI000DBC24F3|nr:metal/formaldehyde-sensitive transcriptional repressor [Sphingomonas sp.]PZU79601.1 MAG: transcriptional regulator [Sphingomonas sp.]